MDERWWQMPGPQGFLRNIGWDLQEGHSVCMGLPSGFDVASLRVALRAHVRALEIGTWQNLRFSPEPEGLANPAESLSGALGLAGDDAGRTHDVQFLASSPSFAGLVIWLEGMEDWPPATVPTWMRFLEEYADAARDQRPLDRTVFCVPLVGPCALEMPSADVLLTERWWWGIISRLDILLFAATAWRGGTGGDGIPAVDQSVVAELAGFNPELAEELLRRPICSPEQMCVLLRDYAEQQGLPRMDATGNAITHASQSGAASPVHLPNAVKQMWAQGVLNWVDQEGLQLHSAVLASSGREGAIRRRIWRAQVRVLLPYVDELRVALCECLVQRNGKQWLAQYAGNREEDIAAIEIGRLKYLCDTDVRCKGLPGSVRELVYWLHWARNELSHLRPLHPDQIAEGFRISQAASAELGGVSYWD